MQRARGFIVGCANGWLWSPGRQSTLNSKLGKLLWAKDHIISILHTGYKVIGYMFAKQSYWYKRRGLLFKLRRPRAFQLSRGLFSSPAGFYWAHIDWLAPGHPMGAGNPTISRKPKPKSRPPVSPSPAAPHNKTYFSASKTNKKNNRHINYRHW